MPLYNPTGSSGTPTSLSNAGGSISIDSAGAIQIEAAADQNIDLAGGTLAINATATTVGIGIENPTATFQVEDKIAFGVGGENIIEDGGASTLLYTAPSGHLFHLGDPDRLAVSIGDTTTSIYTSTFTYGGGFATSTISASGVVSITNTTATNGAGVGALTVAGGTYVAGNVYCAAVRTATERIFLGINNYNIRIASSSAYAWNSTTVNTSGSEDTFLSRYGAGSVQVGTTSSNASGTLRALNVIVGDTFTTSSNGATVTIYGTTNSGGFFTTSNTTSAAISSSSAIILGPAFGWKWCFTSKAFESLTPIMPQRMTKTARDAIVGPVAGMIIYQTDNTPGLRVYNGTNWIKYSESTD